MSSAKGRIKDLFGGNSRRISAPGIYENVSIGAEYVEATSAAGNPYSAIKITVLTEENDSFSKLLLKPSKGFPRPIKHSDGTETTETDEQALYRAENESLAFLSKLAFLTNPNIIEDAEDYKQMALNLIKVVNSDKTVRFNVKLVLDKNDKYLDLPRYADSALELYKVGKEPKLKITDKDNMGIKEAAPSPFGAPASDNIPTPGFNSSELPF